MNYASDVNDSSWEVISKYFTDYQGYCRPRKYTYRDIVNAILYITKTGCQWRMLPINFPPWKSVYYYFSKWKKEGLWDKINNDLRRQIRDKANRNIEPSLCIIDSQSVKTVQKGVFKGYDAGKKIKGRKRHIAVDSLGLLLALSVHSAHVSESRGARLVLMRLARNCGSIKTILVDGGYFRVFIEWGLAMFGYNIVVVKRTDKLKKFKILPKRWIVERTFGWLNWKRRLSKDYEHKIDSSEAFLKIAMVQIMLGKISKFKT